MAKEIKKVEPTPSLDEKNKKKKYDWSKDSPSSTEDDILDADLSKRTPIIDRGSGQA